MGSGERLPSILLAGSDVGAGGATVVALVFLMVAFVVGTVFYRLSPKKVDLRILRTGKVGRPDRIASIKTR
jgi:hypothetical protein